MTLHRTLYKTVLSLMIFCLLMIGLLSAAGCKQQAQSDESDVQMIETEGDIEIIIPEDQDSGGF